MRKRPVDVYSDPELVEVLGGDPELLAIADAIARTGAEPETRPRVRRPVVLLAATVAGAALVLPALAFTNAIPRISDWFSNPRAPTSAIVLFAELGRGAPSGMDPRVIASETRTLMRLTLADGTSVRLFLAPTRQGGFCLDIEGLGGGCDARREIPFNVGSAARRYPQGSAVVYGSALPAKAVETEIRPARGPSERVSLTRVSTPIDAGFFVVNIRDPAHAFPLTVTFLDARGGKIVTKTVPAPPNP